MKLTSAYVGKHAQYLCQYLGGLLELGIANPAHNLCSNKNTMIFGYRTVGHFVSIGSFFCFPRLNCTSACLILVCSAHFNCGVLLVELRLFRLGFFSWIWSLLHVFIDLSMHWSFYTSVNIHILSRIQNCTSPTGGSWETLRETGGAVAWPMFFAGRPPGHNGHLVVSLTTHGFLMVLTKVVNYGSNQIRWSLTSGYSWLLTAR